MLEKFANELSEEEVVMLKQIRALRLGLAENLPE